VGSVANDISIPAFEAYQVTVEGVILVDLAERLEADVTQLAKYNRHYR
jgi:hypothetical protein